MYIEIVCSSVLGYWYVTSLTWTKPRHRSFSACLNTARWKTGDLFLIITVSIRLLKSASNCVLLTPSASHTFVVFLIPERRTTDAIIRDCRIPHSGTPKTDNGRANVFCYKPLEPPLVHLLQKLYSDGIARGINIAYWDTRLWVPHARYSR